MRRLRVAVVGSGVGVGHIEAYLALPEMYEIVAFCDIDAERASEVAGRFGIAAIDTSLDGTLARDLDLVDLCTPSGLHFAQAARVMRAGHDVIVEKPVASSLAEVDELARISTETGRAIHPIFQYRFGHGIQKLHHLIARGVAGPPSVATAETQWYRADAYYGRAPWRGTWAGELGGCFTTHAIHIHDLLCEVLGPVRSVHARSSNRLNGNETEDMGLVSLAFENGAMAASSVTLGSRDQMSRLRFCFRDLCAESGRAPYNPGHEPWTFPHDDGEQAARIEAALADFEPLPERFVGQFHRMHKAITEGGPPPVTLADARRSIELLTAIYASVNSGETVRLPISNDHPFYRGWAEIMGGDKSHG
ncbi:MAG: Gfo/Idh/MocA family oxidoreductase [Geminicoccaceae bacterium]|nr:Gfo/Idh/MocA family oxidoreductase [Geminicoccaceae bacterium]